MTSPQTDAETEALAQVIRSAEERVRLEEQEVLAHIRNDAGTRAVARLRQVREAVTALQTTVDKEGRAWLQNTLPRAYAEGAIDALAPLGGRGFSWTHPNVAAIQKLATETHGELLHASQEAGRTSQAFAAQVREVAREIAPGTLAQGTAPQVGRELARRLEDKGLMGVVYADASRHSVAFYTEMLARTKTALAYNTAAFTEYRESDIKWVEVFDGASCGWVSHDDPDKANGTIRKLEDAEAFPISHPQCRRAFGGRPDVTNARQAQEADLSTTAAQRVDQQQAEEDRAAALARRAANRSSARRRGNVEAQHLTPSRGASAPALPPAPAPPPPPAPEAPVPTIRDFTDEQLEAAMGLATEEELDVIVAELDRREAEALRLAQRREKAAARKLAEEDRKATALDEAILAGDDPEHAVERIYGKTVEKQRQERAIVQMRGQGYDGAGFHELSAKAFRDEADRQYFAAEEATRGNVINAAGQRAGVDPRSLFTGPESRARKYASEEVLQWWQDHGRLTLDNFRAGLIGGKMDEATGGYWL